MDVRADPSSGASLHRLRRDRPLRRARGFTLIELVAVIAIVSVVAVVALPQYVDLTASAHRASVASTAGAFASAIQTAHMLCVVRDHGGKDNLPGYGPGTVDFGANCYPTDATGGNSNNQSMNRARCMRVWRGVLAVAPTIAADLSADYRAQVASGLCRFVYTDEPARRFTYDAATGAVAVTNP